MLLLTEDQESWCCCRQGGPLRHHPATPYQNKNQPPRHSPPQTGQNCPQNLQTTAEAKAHLQEKEGQEEEATQRQGG